MFYLLCISAASYFLLSYNKVSIHLYINQFVGNKLLDNFFFYITYLGDGLMLPVLLVIIIFYNIRLGIYTAVSFFTAAIVTSILKYQFFNDEDRPKQIFEWTLHIPLKFVDITDVNIHRSFPSGHATQVFAIFMCLIFFTRRPEFKFLFFVIALVSAFSRVYLSQHWLIDITAGSIIGTICSILYYFFILHNNKFQSLNKPLLKQKIPDSRITK